MTKKEWRNALLKKENKFATAYIVVANTYDLISFDELTRKLNLLNAIVNKKLFRYYKKYPEKRIQFAYNHQRASGNTHSHLILKVPEEYQSYNEIQKIINLMRFKWWLLDDRQTNERKFAIWFQKVDGELSSEFFNVQYAVRQNKNDTAQNFEPRFGIL